MERPGAITLHGNPLTLVGPELAVGQPAPTFEMRGADMQPVRLADTSGKTRIFVVVPSLDTPVCDQEARTFNERASELGPGVALYVVSRDTAFAQKRVCTTAGLDRVTTLSDHIDGNFGKAWGLYIKENGLNARAVVVLDPSDVVRYVQLVPAVEQQPDFDDALTAAKAVAGS